MRSRKGKPPLKNEFAGFPLNKANGKGQPRTDLGTCSEPCALRDPSCSKGLWPECGQILAPSGVTTKARHTFCGYSLAPWFTSKWTFLENDFLQLVAKVPVLIWVQPLETFSVLQVGPLFHHKGLRKLAYCQKKWT